MSYNMFSINFVTYIKMTKDFLVKCYQNKKKKTTKNACDIYQILYEKIRKISDNMVKNGTKIYL